MAVAATEATVTTAAEIRTSTSATALRGVVAASAESALLAAELFILLQMYDAPLIMAASLAAIAFMIDLPRTLTTFRVNPLLKLSSPAATTFILASLMCNTLLMIASAFPDASGIATKDSKMFYAIAGVLVLYKLASTFINWLTVEQRIEEATKIQSLIIPKTAADLIARHTIITEVTVSAAATLFSAAFAYSFFKLIHPVIENEKITPQKYATLYTTIAAAIAFLAYQGIRTTFNRFFIRAVEQALEAFLKSRPTSTIASDATDTPSTSLLDRTSTTLPEVKVEPILTLALKACTNAANNSTVQILMGLIDGSALMRLDKHALANIATAIGSITGWAAAVIAGLNVLAESLEHFMKVPTQSLPWQIAAPIGALAIAAIITAVLMAERKPEPSMRAAIAFGPAATDATTATAPHTPTTGTEPGAIN